MFVERWIESEIIFRGKPSMKFSGSHKWEQSVNGVLPFQGTMTNKKQEAERGRSITEHRNKLAF